MASGQKATDLLDDNQAGFRKGRSTADATQILMRLQEDGVDLRKRGGAGAGQDDFVPSARLLDLRKAYPRVNKAALWLLLRRYGLDGDFLRLVQDLHESTEYEVRSKEGNSDPWVPERGLTEGCPSSPGLFNVYHQAPMRIAKREREKKAEEDGRKAGIVMKWVPGSAFPAVNTWEKKSSEAVAVVVEKSLFADDTTAVGEKKELSVGIEVTKTVMGSFEERNNDDKEESLEFGSDESGRVRMLGTWLGWKEDVDKRLARAGKSWFALRNRLIGSKMSKKMQARVVEVCVESTLLFDCQVRVWYVGELNRMQRFMDRIYRYVWSRKTKPPLIQMQEEQKNMFDVRKELGVSTVRGKVEKRVLERIGHVMRMDDERMTKICVLGWMEELENFEKAPGRRRKTILYWKKIMREAGLDPTDAAALTRDRKIWRSKVNDRMRHLSKWEESKGNKWAGVPVERNEVWHNVQVFDCRVCGRVCKSKAGLVNHRRRMHEESAAKKTFECEACKMVFKKLSESKNHAKVCGGAVPSAAGRVMCICGSEYSKSYIARHRRACVGWQNRDQQPAATAAAAAAAPRGPCPNCGAVMRKDNIARHGRTACPGSVAGP